jgi:hypothetical protein
MRQNVAAGVVGLFIWPVWLGMDFQDAAGKEAKALSQRNEYLMTLAKARCGPPHKRPAFLSSKRVMNMDSRETVRTASVALGALFLACLCASPASACSEPSFYAGPPNAPGTYDKPDVPFCFRDRSCEEWQVKNYVSEVEDYVGKLKRYAEEAIEFSHNARSFADDALSYAKCEADDVNTQHR